MILLEGIQQFPEKAMAPHSSTLAQKIPWTQEPGRLQSMGSLGFRHDSFLFSYMHRTDQVIAISMDYFCLMYQVIWDYD